MCVELAKLPGQVVVCVLSWPPHLLSQAKAGYLEEIKDWEKVSAEYSMQWCGEGGAFHTWLQLKADDQRRRNEVGVQWCESYIHEYQQKISLLEAAPVYKGVSLTG